ncbi:MAG TPA: thrombospondin type 3 repeat-containing protein [Pseudomonadota bacterium]|nr:thrombospondin type 3 repeat-containing protein [Pseudomonadota bacterium]
MLCSLRVGLPSVLLALWAAPGLAAPVAIPSQSAVAIPRRDVGSGLCANAVHLTMSNALTSVDAARAYLSPSAGMTNIDDRLTTRLAYLNFINNVDNARSDLPNPEPLPFSPVASAQKPSDGQNVAMRLRGYMNIAKAGIYTFGVQADDGFSLLIGGTPISQSTTNDVSLRYSRQVQFSTPGLYSVELTYYQNRSQAVLMVARSPQADLEVSASTTPFPASFQLIEQTSLFSAVAGTSACSECAADTDCTNGGEYCGAGICQACNNSRHCGASCTPCSADKPICNGGTCGPCTSDLQCLDGQICDTARGGCITRPDLQFAGGCSAGSPDATASRSGAPLLALLGVVLSLLFFARRRAPRDAERAKPMPLPLPTFRSGRHLLMLAALLLPSAAWAQSNPPFNAQTFRPDFGPGSVFTVQGSSVPRSIMPYGGVLFEYANRPLRLYDTATGQNYANTVSGMVTAHVMPGISLASFLALHVDVPVVMFQAFDARTPQTDVPLSPTIAGLGDVRAMIKLQAADNRNGGFGVALSPEFSFPSGSTQSFRGEGAVTILPRLVIDYRFDSQAFVAFNVGYLIRTANRNVDYGLVRVSDQLRYGLGLGVPLPKGLTALAEIAGAFSPSRIEGGPFYTPLEGLLGLRYRHKKGIEVTVGGGGDFVSAVGWPNFRVLGSVAFIPMGRRAAPRVVTPPPEEPTTPAGAEEPTSPAPSKPEAPTPPPVSAPSNDDPDGDGVLGRADACPREAGPAEAGGCPDQDKDGIADKQDQCPKVAGVREKGGCPDTTDTDKDGILDRDDQCPIEPGLADNKGCPDRDEDRDGIVDRLDKCPKAAGSKEDEGCPLMEMAEDRIKLGRPIRFMQDSVTIDSGSRAGLAAVAKAIRDDKTLTSVVIEVSASGDKRAAKGLAKKRASALQKLLTDAGISKKVLKVGVAKAGDSDEITKIELTRAGGKGAGKGSGTDDGGADGGKSGRRHHRRSKG